MYAHRTHCLISSLCGLYACFFERSTQAWLERSTMCVIMHSSHCHFASVMDWGQLSLISCDFSTSTLRSLLLKGRTFIVSADALSKDAWAHADICVKANTNRHHWAQHYRPLPRARAVLSASCHTQGIFQCELHRNSAIGVFKGKYVFNLKGTTNGYQ